VVGILIALSHRFFPEITGLAEPPVNTRELIMWSYVGLSVGDLLSGLLSQILQSRKKVIYLNLLGITLMTLLFLFGPAGSAGYYKTMAFILGSATGYWAIFVTNASEQFGTNIRSTVSATVPNFVRGGVLIITSSFEWFETSLQSSIWAATWVGLACLALALWGTWYVEEPFHKDLDYYES